MKAITGYLLSVASITQKLYCKPFASEGMVQSCVQPRASYTTNALEIFRLVSHDGQILWLVQFMVKDEIVLQNLKKNSTIKSFIARSEERLRNGWQVSMQNLQYEYPWFISGARKFWTTKAVPSISYGFYYVGWKNDTDFATFRTILCKVASHISKNQFNIVWNVSIRIATKNLFKFIKSKNAVGNHNLCDALPILCSSLLISITSIIFCLIYFVIRS